MNILHHKSWHVRNKDNIERVRRDEENARKEEEERLRKVALAESEARTSILRARAKNKQRNDDTVYEKAKSSDTTAHHINFFAEEEQGVKKGGANAEHEAEKKAEKEKQEKAIGLLTYLGQSAVEGQTSKPWYYAARTRDKDGEQSSTKHKDEWDSKKKSTLDPIHMMKKYMNTKRKIEGKAPEPVTKKYKTAPPREERRAAVSVSCSSTDSESDNSTSKKKKKKKHKHKKKHKKHNKEKKSHKDKPCDKLSPNKSNTLSKGNRTLAELRAERLKRELAERQKSKDLFAKLRGEKSREERDLEKTMDDRTRGYNSQFNPEFARKPKKKKDWLNMLE